MFGISVAAVAPEPITTTCLPSSVEIVRPGLRMHDAALEVAHARPIPACSLRNGDSSPGTSRGSSRYDDLLAAVGLLGLDGPEILLARPARRQDPVLVADVPGEIVVLDHLAHIGADFVGGRDRRPDPGLEAVAEGVEIAVGADARIFVRPPGAAERLLRLQDDEARAGHASSADDRRCRCRKCRRRRSARRNVRVACEADANVLRAASTFIVVFFSADLTDRLTSQLSASVKRMFAQGCKMTQINVAIHNSQRRRPIAARSAKSSRDRALAASRR